MERRCSRLDLALGRSPLIPDLEAQQAVLTISKTISHNLDTAGQRGSHAGTAPISHDLDTSGPTGSHAGTALPREETTPFHTVNLAAVF